MLLIKDFKHVINNWEVMWVKYKALIIRKKIEKIFKNLINKIKKWFNKDYKKCLKN